MEQTVPTVELSTDRMIDDRYSVGALLGSGGMADVFRARDLVLKRDVAIKVFRHGAVADAFGARSAAEVHLVAGLNHPGLVTVFDAGRSDARDGAFAYLVMELVDGRSLAAALADGPLPPRTVVAVGAQLAAALAYVHGCDVVHRDVKPANVLLSDGHGDGPVAKLADFGVARVLDGVRLTEAGTTVGTANYLSPEQTRGSTVDAPSDVYALGLVLLESLTGVPAYPGSGVEAAVARLHRRPDIPASVPAELRSLLDAMTADSAADRPPAAVVAARLGALELVPEHVARADTVVLAASRLSPRQLGYGVAAAVGIIAIALAATLLPGSSATAGHGRPASSVGGSAISAPTPTSPPTGAAAHGTAPSHAAATPPTSSVHVAAANTGSSRTGPASSNGRGHAYGRSKSHAERKADKHGND